MNRRSLALAAVLLAVTSCGIQPDPAPRRIDDLLLPTPSGSRDPSALARPMAVTIYLVDERSLVPVRRLVDAPATVMDRLTSLASGPTDREATDGLRTAIAGGIAVESVGMRGDTAVVALAPSSVEAGTEEQIIALAQIVFTLTESREATVVVFTVNGDPVSVPRADGSLASVPVSRADYAGLLRLRRSAAPR